jgi:hypothetical protein
MDHRNALKTEPVSTKKAGPKKKQKAARKQTHHKKCGEVGKTGEHGHLGTNAAK